MSFRVVIKGDKDLVRLLSKAPEIFRAAVDRAGAELAARIANDARSICPYRTGRLMRSIYIQRVGAGSIPMWAVGAATPYARYVEFGTRFMAGRYFMRNAFLMVQPDINEVMREQIRAYWRSSLG